MMLKIIKILAILVTTFSLTANASDFCDGFEVGYKTIAGNTGYVPACPYEPYTPYNSTPYQEGIKAGMKAAKR